MKAIDEVSREAKIDRWFAGTTGEYTKFQRKLQNKVCTVSLSRPKDQFLIWWALWGKNYIKLPIDNLSETRLRREINL